MEPNNFSRDPVQLPIAKRLACAVQPAPTTLAVQDFPNTQKTKETRAGRAAPCALGALNAPGGRGPVIRARIFMRTPREAMHQRGDCRSDLGESSGGKRPSILWTNEMVDGPPAGFLVKGLKKEGELALGVLNYNLTVINILGVPAPLLQAARPSPPSEKQNSTVPRQTRRSPCRAKNPELLTHPSSQGRQRINPALCGVWMKPRLLVGRSGSRSCPRRWAAHGFGPTKGGCANRQSSGCQNILACLRLRSAPGAQFSGSGVATIPPGPTGPAGRARPLTANSSCGRKKWVSGQPPPCLGSGVGRAPGISKTLTAGPRTRRDDATSPLLASPAAHCPIQYSTR